MITTREFKQLHALSDSSFRRLCNRIKTDHPDTTLTRRINAQDWEILDVALFEEYLPVRKPDQPSDQPEQSNEAAIVPVQVEVMGVESLTQQQTSKAQALTLREQTTNLLNDANQTRLAQLKEFFANQQTQRQTDYSQRIAQLQAQAQNEAIEEFLIKQQAKEAIANQLEQLNSLGKLPVAQPESIAT